MPIHNTDVAALFDKMADLLEIEGANPFRVRAYRNAARVAANLSVSLADMVDRGEDLAKLPGIGKDLAAKIDEIVRTGAMSQLQELEGRLPPALTEMMNIAALGPRRVQILHERLGVNDLKDLKAAAVTGKIKTLKGFGPKIEEAVLTGIGRLEKREKRFRLARVEPVAQSLTKYLQETAGVQQAIVAGSYRRRLETVGDLDILVTGAAGCPVMDRFVDYDEVAQVLAKGETRSTVVLRSGLQVDLRVVAPESYGAALHYFTGSKAHNIAVRKLGVHRGLKINEYGVFKGEAAIAGRTEEEVYRQVDLPYIEPELREDRGEIEAAQAGRLPKLVRPGDIRGDLHAHTKETDGRNTLEEMARAAQDHGYQYLAISDHSKRVTMVHGLDAARLAQHLRKIDRLNDGFKGFRLLKAIEVDILEDGSLDLEDDILKELDITICAVHYKHNLTREKQTERIIRAMDNPYCDILAHPTGRLIDKRQPYDVDLERVILAARDRGCFLEVDAQPDRLDLADVHCKLAKDLGVKVAISTDAHSIADLDFMRFGLGQARRGWLEPDDVLNTRPWEELRTLLKKRP